VGLSVPAGAQARSAAAGLIQVTLDERRTLDEALARVDAYSDLTGADRGFARAIASAALRQLGRIDRVLAGLTDRRLDALDPPLLALLRAGAAQLWCLDTPHHAAVSQTVAAAKLDPKTRRGAGMVNAVLRRAVDQHDRFVALPARATWPDWLQTAMVDSLGETAAENLARAQLTPPTRQVTPRGDAAALAERLGATQLASGSIAVANVPVDSLPDYADGTWWIQDQAAACAARLLNVGPGDHVIDLCAAPGGKTLQLAATGARVTAVDRAPKRLARLSENLQRTGLSTRVEIVEADAATWRPAAPVDAVLLDPPCSALGTLRRHPEGAWIKARDTLAGYPGVQARLLEAALAMVRPGGCVVYSVCTPLRGEGPEPVSDVLCRVNAERGAIPDEAIRGLGHIRLRDGEVILSPGPGDDHDAFFIARIVARP
jgi:16S rRNA (cytosine967-C5)-methyltransferase